MKTRRPSAEAKLPVAKPSSRSRKQKQFAKDEDKWLIPSATTTLQVAFPNEFIAEMDDALDDLYPALRDREDFVYKASEYALESWQEEKATPEGKALVALAQKKRRQAARKKPRTPKQKQII